MFNQYRMVTQMLRREFVTSMPLIPAALARPRRVRLGIRTATYRTQSMKEAATLIRAAGFQGVQLGLWFADARLDLNSPDWSYARRARDIFAEAGVPILGLDGYVSLVHPDPATRQANLRGLVRLIEHAADFGTNIIGTEAGSFHPGERGRARPDDPVAGWKLFMHSMGEGVRAAQSAGVILAFEPTLSTLVGTIDEVRRMLDEIGSPHLKIIWDAAHYYDSTNVGDIPGLLKRMYKSFGSDVVMAHANDFRITQADRVQSCDIGDGKLDYATFISLLDRGPKDILLAVEHTKEADVPRVKRYLDKFFA